MTRSIDLGKPVVSPANVRETNYFNGRLLTAEALRDEQAAQVRRNALLGRSMGVGVVDGLWVTTGPVDEAGFVRSLNVTAGLAIDPLGRSVVLADGVTVRLVPEATVDDQEAGLFYRCRLPEPEPVGAGAYILVATRVGVEEGLVPRVELQFEGVASDCGVARVTSGVRFDAIPADAALDPTLREEVATWMASGTVAGRSLARNVLAYECFGATSVAIRFEGGGDPSGGATPALSAGLRARLGEDQVPLALFVWQNHIGVDLLDVWSVRRLVSRDPVSAIDYLGTSGPAEQLATASLRQFQDHVRWLQGSTLSGVELVQLEARQYFRHLPAVGFLPVARLGADRGFEPRTFFGSMAPSHEIAVEASRLPDVTRRGAWEPPIPVHPHPPHDPAGTSPPISVDPNPPAVTVQLFEPRSDGVRAAPVLVFRRRGLDAPAECDAVADRFQSAWLAYEGLRAFHPFEPSGTADAPKVRELLASGISRVVTRAAYTAALLCSGSLSHRPTIARFAEFHRVQLDLRNVLAALEASGAFTAVSGVETFLSQFDPLLASLLATANAGDLGGAVAAQDAINVLVGGQTGSGVPTRPVIVAYQTSDSSNLRPGQTSNHDFTIENQASQPRTVDLFATIAGAPPVGGGSIPMLVSDWGTAVTIVAGGALVTSLRMTPNSTQNVRVVVAAPSSANPADLGKRAELTLRARGRSPDPWQHADGTIAAISMTAGPPPDRVEFLQPPDPALDPTAPGSPTNPMTVAAGGFRTLPLQPRYVAPAGTGATQFDLTLSITGNWQLVDEAGAPARTLTLTPGIPDDVDVFIVAGTDAAATATITLTSASDPSVTTALNLAVALR